MVYEYKPFHESEKGIFNNRLQYFDFVNLKMGGTYTTHKNSKSSGISDKSANSFHKDRNLNTFFVLSHLFFPFRLVWASRNILPVQTTLMIYNHKFYVRSTFLLCLSKILADSSPTRVLNDCESCFVHVFYR